ncbi:MAG TPA: TonB-dependent receptor [Caulobacteraceae bacterium]|jgi:iron complex outermembrane receptor protein|nr:TonB-dependent receptor [Caulobacteraceae bacterium]
MKSLRFALMAGVAGALTLSSAGAAFADDDAPANTVSQVIVTTPNPTPLDQPAAVDKTGAPIKDIPRSIQVVPRELMDEQGAIKLVDTLRDVSGVTQGGQFNFGFFDRVIIRGLNATYLDDGLPDGTSDLTGYVHTLTGVERVEVLKGPGSALYGSTEEGGTINLVHYRPSDVPGAGVSAQFGSFATATTDAYVTGPTGLKNVDFRLDGEYSTTSGFRGLGANNTELLAALSWRPSNHDVEFRYEYHNFRATPDATGIPFSPPNGVGQPLAVPLTDTYYTPGAFSDQTLQRLFLSDAWTINDTLTINLRGAYSNRDVDLARNAGGSVSQVGGLYALTRRQLREQSDELDDFNFQAEPTWHFHTGSLNHLLVTGFEARDINGVTTRATADLPNIANIFAPVVTDPAISSLAFKCDSGHSCDNARLNARLYGLYATDQIDVTDALKVRLSVRQDWFDTQGEARTLVPVNAGQEQPCNPPTANACPWVPGVPIKRNDSVTSYDVGAVYFLTKDLSVFAGYSADAYPIFNTEEPESIGQVPESGRQVEGGLRYELPPILTLSSAVYHATREHVFTLLSEPNPSGPGNIDVAQVFSYGVTGWETDVNLHPLPALNIIANVAAQDGRITSFPQTPADVGRQPPSVPSFLANAWMTYDVDLGHEVLKTLQLQLGARYRNKEYADAGETRQIPGSTLVDAGVSLPIKAFTINAGVDNVFDRRVFLFADGTGGGAFPGPGRTWFLRLSAKW